MTRLHGQSQWVNLFYRLTPEESQLCRFCVSVLKQSASGQPVLLLANESCTSVLQDHVHVVLTKQLGMEGARIYLPSVPLQIEQTVWADALEGSQGSSHCAAVSAR